MPLREVEIHTVGLANPTKDTPNPKYPQFIVQTFESHVEAIKFAKALEQFFVKHKIPASDIHVVMGKGRRVWL